MPELAVLSTMAHPELEIAEAAFQAILPLPEEKNQLYLDVILSTLPAVIRQVLEARMERYEYQSEFARKYYGQGMQQGREEGMQQGREEGMQDGLRTAVVAFARAKLTDFSDADLAAIEATSDPGVLTELVTLLGQATSAVEARGALGRALERHGRK
jgi:flagellar biosynthesis/type III secretory pathway protein FliH